MESFKEGPKGLARLKAEQAKIGEQIQEARKPSKMLFELMETTNPDDSIQHDPDLAAQYDALFLTRKGNQALIGYLTQRPISYEELEKWYREGNALKEQGVTVDGSLEDQPGESLNYYIEGKKVPSVTLSKVPIDEDPRFTIDGDTQDLGITLVILQINLDDFKNPLIQHVLNVLAQYNTVAAYLPKQFVYNPNYGNLSEAELESIQEAIHEDEQHGREFIEENKSELSEEDRKSMEQSISHIIQEKKDYPEKFSRQAQEQLRGLPFTEAAKIPFAMEAIKSIANKYSQTKFYYGEKPSE